MTPVTKCNKRTWNQKLSLTNDGHPLKHAVHVLQSLKQLLHHIRLVKICSQCDENLFVQQHQLPQFCDLALYVPHQGLVEKFDSIGTCHNELRDEQC